MKIIFLDIDGVLNSVQSANYWNRRVKEGSSAVGGLKKLCPIACSNLQYILEKDEDIKIVLSSTWRISDNWKENFKNAEMPHAILSRIIDRTPRKLSMERGHEIKLWLEYAKEEGLGVEDFIIIDDDHYDMGEFRGTSRFINTSATTGIVWDEVERIIKYFKIDEQKIDAYKIKREDYL
jgi:hypothetical protein